VFLLSFEDRCELFSIRLGCHNTRSTLQRAEKLVHELQTPTSLSDISKKMRIKEKYMKKKLDRFIDKDCIRFEGGMYVSLILI
jgi:predicted ArsR family transcriptional regulator